MVNVNVSLKAGRSADSPWVTLEGDPTQVDNAVSAIVSGEFLGKVVAASEVFRTLFEPGAAPAQTIGQSPPQGVRPPQGVTPPTPVHAPAPGIAQAPAPGGFAQGQQVQVPQATFQGNPGGGSAAGVGGYGAVVEEDRFGAKFVLNHPQAPTTPTGPAVLKRWRANSGKITTAWIDNRLKAVPSNYQAGVREDPPKDQQFFEMIFGNDVDTSMLEAPAQQQAPPQSQYAQAYNNPNTRPPF